MKTISTFLLLSFFVPLMAQNENPPADASAGTNQPDLLPNQRAFLTLPEEKRMEFVKSLGEANRVFQQKRIFETLEQIDKASEIFADSPELHNLRGSCFVEMRSFHKALEEFGKAAALSKDNPSITFNIGEVYFVTKEWQKAHDTFQKVLSLLPEDNLALGRLVEFKILLCKKKLGQAEETAALAGKYDFTDDSPFHYFAQAALAYEDKNLVKAEEWLAIAGRVFRDPNILAPWQDTMVEFGYIKSFYGEESGEDQ
jgi:tetratricopeptide (TPR) repeat protein